MRNLVLSAALTLGAMSCKKSGTPVLPEVTTAQYPGGMKLVEEVAAAGDKVVIPYRKFEMPNGLTVILHEDDSDPLVHVDVTYHVGSGREDIGRSGFAHFFEHMMFQGSENVADEEHFKIITEAGGTLNGTTNSDRTNYFETVPSNQLEKMLWLEADRMGFLLDAVTQEKFEVQRETVKNERGQRVDNRPYGLLSERVGEAMYPEGHPYSWSTIGYLEDLDRADVNDLKRFFLRWYGPNNAALTIGGKFDEEQTLEWVARYFGSIPRGPAVEMPDKPEVTLDADRYIHLEDNVSLPLIYMAWPTVSARHPDEAPLDVLMGILGSGPTSLLYKNLVKDGLAVQATAGHGCSELHCKFTLLALPTPGNDKTLADMEEVMRASLVEFEERGVQDDDLIKLKAEIVSGMIFGLESVSGKVSQLAANETFTGNPNYIEKDIERYETVTKEDVVRVYNEYIKGKNAVIMSIVPKGQTDLIAHGDTWERYERTIPDVADAGELEMRRATDDFDRSVQPPAGDNPQLTLPDIWRQELDNGVKVIGAVNDETPTTTITIQLTGGQRVEPLEKAGLASLTASMMSESTMESTTEELSNRLEKLGSSVWFSSYNNESEISIRTLTKNLDATLAIASEMLFQPKFDDADFARVKSQTIEGIKSNKKDAGFTASAVFNGLLYGKQNVFALPDSGTLETVDAITVEDVKNFYGTQYTPAAATIIAVSDLDSTALTEKLGVFSGWEGGPAPKVALAPFPELEAGTLYLIDKPEAAQSEIRIGKRSLPYDATGEYYKSQLMNYTLGGAFNSRINLNLREDKGYTYGARSYFRGYGDYGAYVAAAGVRSDTTAKSIVEFMKELKTFASDGITADELTFTQNSIGQRDALKYETPSDKADFLGDMVRYGLSESFVDEQAAILGGLTKAEADTLAKRHLATDEMILVVVGDAAKNKEELAGLGYPIVMMDADGNRL